MISDRERALLRGLRELVTYTTSEHVDADKVRALLDTYSETPVVLTGNPCFDVDDAALYASVSPRRMRQWITELAMPVVYLTDGAKGRRGIRQRDLDAFLDKRTVRSA